MWSCVLLLEMLTEQIKVEVGGCGERYGNPPPQQPLYAHLTSELSSCLFHADLSPFPPYLHVVLQGEGSFPFLSFPSSLATS